MVSPVSFYYVPELVETFGPSTAGFLVKKARIWDFWQSKMAQSIIAENVEWLKQEEKKAKIRLTREINKLQDLLQTGNTSKNTIKHYISKIKAEFSIIEKILNNLKELSI